VRETVVDVDDVLRQGTGLFLQRQGGTGPGATGLEVEWTLAVANTGGQADTGGQAASATQFSATRSASDAIGAACRRGDRRHSIFYLTFN
jgi:hypothetical protein